MNPTYFPHYEGGSETFEGQVTNKYTFNILPLGAVAIDPRDIISEWTTASRSSLSASEVYKGMKLFCEADYTLWVCVWTPKTGREQVYTGDDCIWEQIPIGQYFENEWQDVTGATGFYHETTEEKVANANTKIWQYSMSQYSSYWGYFDIKLPSGVNLDTAAWSDYWDDDKTNDLLNQMVAWKKMKNKTNTDVLDICGSYNKLQTSNVSQTVNFNDPTGNFSQAVGNYLVVVVPSNTRTDGSGRNVTINYSVGGTVYIYDTLLDSPKRSTLTLSIKTASGFVNDVFDVYIVNNPIKVSGGAVLPTTDDGIKLNFTKV